MAFVGGGINRQSSRDSSPGFRFTLFAAVSLVLMYYDQRDSWLERVRYYMQAAAYPIQVAVSSPQALWRWGSDSLQSRESLQSENEALRDRERQLAVTVARYSALEKENARLRALDQALPPLITRSQVAEVISNELTLQRQRLLINRGARNADAYRSQPVVDARGLVGQLVRVGPWSAEIILITDPEHATPVELVRNGLRSIAVGSGNSNELLLPYLAVNSDVKPGDLLVTSGLGGVFPAGYPVAVVTGIKRDPVLLLAQVRAQPLATLTRDREVMMLWFDKDHPAAPIRREQIDTLPEATTAAAETKAAETAAAAAAAAAPPTPATKSTPADAAAKKPAPARPAVRPGPRP
jgi:rod shape-determining protein MreC